MDADRRLPLGMLALLALFPGCARDADRAAPGVLARWEEKFGIKSQGVGPARSLAEAPADGQECLSAGNTLDRIKADVREAERATSGPPVTGSWNGINLSTFGPMGGRFLKDLGNTQYSGSGVRFTGCATIPCVVNRIYGADDDAIQGWRLY
ncbi:MAG: hypothetical protein IT285_15585 [Bdellovibrionales bacterium]|nr:hypothetical protein [Bdellovibrionales bacterium]